jgi:hypothetical protein
MKIKKQVSLGLILRVPLKDMDSIIEYIEANSNWIIARKAWSTERLYISKQENGDVTNENK